MTTVSIIIPYYNTPLEYFRELIESLKILDPNNFEVVLVDDGSTNKDILDYVNTLQDNKLFVLSSIEHRGVSAARNKGIDLAKNEYIMFVDSDDFVNTNLLIAIINNNLVSDIVFIKTGYDKNDSFFDEVFILKKQVDIERLFSIDRNLPEIEQYSYRTVYSKLIKSDFVKTTKFVDKLVYCEDCIYCGELYKKMHTYGFVDKKFYLYRQNLFSQTRKFDYRFIERYSMFFDKFMQLNKEYPSRVYFVMHDTIAIHLNVRVCMSIKRFHWIYAYKFVKSNFVKCAAIYFKYNSHNIQNYRKRICWMIRHRLYMLSIASIVFHRLFVKLGLILHK